MGWIHSQFPSPKQGYIAGCALLPDNQIMLRLIFPSSAAPGSGTEFNHRQSFPMNFRFGPCQGNVFFYRDAQHGAFQKLIPCRESPWGQDLCLTKPAMWHTQALSSGWFSWKWVDRGRIGVKDFSPVKSPLPSTKWAASSSSLWAHPPVLPKEFSRSSIDCLETGGTWAVWEWEEDRFKFFFETF